MHRSPHGRELFIRVIHDEAFGPAITFGAGGVAIEILHDRAVALPPLNDFLIKRMIEGTHVERLLRGYRRLPAVDPRGLITVLLRVSEMVCELPQIQELDINPLVADENGVVALDAYMSIGLANLSADPYGHMAIYPYPSHLASRWQLADGTDLAIRPIRPEDAKIEKEFVESLSAESKYFRFMQSLEKLTPAMLVRLTQIDYDREMALIAVAEVDGQELEVGVVRYAINPDGRSCEFALTVADAWQNKGIGTHLMRRIMEIAKTRGLQTIEGEVLASNSRMLGLVKALGFSIHTDPDDPAIKIVRRTL
jgi:acetyltransferase